MFLVSIYNRMYEEGHGARGICAMRMEKLEHMEGSGEFRTGWSVDSFIYIYIYTYAYIHTYARIWRQLGQNVVHSIGNNFWESLSDWLFILLTLIQSLIVRSYRFKFLFCSVLFPRLICGKKFFSKIENCIEIMGEKIIKESSVGNKYERNRSFYFSFLLVSIFFLSPF